MPGTRPLYVPLRGNAYTLVAGAPGAAFRRSLKLSALLHDRLILEDGVWVGISGPGGNSEFRHPLDPGPNGGAWQTARERSGAPDSEWHLAVRPSRSAGPMREILRSKTTLSWRASFEPIKRELPRGYSWIDFGSFDLHPSDRQLAKTLARRELRDGVLRARFPDEFSRALVADSAMRSMLLSARMGTALKLDSAHREVMAARIVRGEARPVLGGRALLAVVPDVRNLAWDEIDQIRQLPGLPRLRAILAEVEAASMEAAQSKGSLDIAAVRDFHRQYATAVNEASWHPHGASVAIGAAVSIATSPLVAPASALAGIVLTAAIEGARFWRNQRQRRDSWMAAADRLNHLAERD